MRTNEPKASPFMKAVISGNGQIVLPAALRQQDHIQAGQEFEILRLHEGTYLLRRVKHRRNEGLVELLLSCPMKDWFQAATTQTKDEIPVPRLG